MKFRIFLVAALFVLSFAAVACSDDPENQQEQQDTGTAGDGDGDDVSGDGDGEDTGAGDTDDAGAGDGDGEDTGAGDTDDAGAGDTDDAGQEDVGDDDDAGQEDAGDDDAGGDELPESCAEINGDSCFSNYDCAASERCADLSGDETDICCIPGDRGTGEAGDLCDEGVDGQEFCESGVCLSRNDSPYMCTTTCDSADECPASMSECGVIPFTGEDDWCLPPAE